MRYLVFLALANTLPISASADEISVQDGAWTSQLMDVTLSETCPAETTAIVLPQFEESIGQSSTREIEFGGDFDPNLLEEGNRPYGWTQTDDNTWEGTVLGDGDDREVGIATLTVESDTLISVVNEIDLAPMLNPSEDPNFTAMFPPGCSATMIMQISYES
ncbi:hypothetical protein V8J82_22105 [Gymnodinialimonas sp. 2305UL16-5]|uniref:hypothetical protein n=1 Tax=Gymnodinialimonas mytili TaxID=3126503 RepID=UPI0030B7D732